MLTSPAPLNCGGNTFCSKVGKPTLLKSKIRDVEAKENKKLLFSRNVVWEPQVFLGEVSSCIYCSPASQLARSSIIPPVWNFKISNFKIPTCPEQHHTTRLEFQNFKFQNPNLTRAALYHPFGISIRVYARCQGMGASYKKQICFPGSRQKFCCLRFSQWKMLLDPDAFDI